MASGNDPNAWLGLLKWSLSHQDGTEPSDVRSMSDEDRRWLERVVSEGVRDDVKAMTEIYSRLCDYLDVTASEMHGTPPSAAPPQPPSEHQQHQQYEGNEQVSPQQEAVGTETDQDDPSRAAEAAVPPREGGLSPAEVAVLPPPPSAVLSTFLAPPASGGGIGSVGTMSSSSDHQRVDDTGDGVVQGGGSANTAGRGERLEHVLDDLEELKDIVEQIDMAATFVKVGGFGRLIALVGPGYRPEKLRLRAASVIATLTKNNPPAQTEFSTSGGHKALLDAALGSDNRGVAEDGDTGTSSSPPSSRLSFALQRAILHALSCSVMGAPAGEDELCKDARFQAFLAGAIAQQGRGDSTGDEDGVSTGEGGEGVGNEKEEGEKLRGKAAFVLKALVGAPGASVERAKALWPAILGLAVGLEEITPTRDEEDAEEGEGGITAVARETCIEALVAAGRSLDGARVVTELGSRVSAIMSRRRQILVEAQNRGSGTRSEEDLESAEIELGLWLQWESLSGPAQ